MDVEGCELPDDRWYDLENDVWLKPEADPRFASIGLTASFASFAGKFTAVTFRDLIGEVTHGRSVATIESLRLTGPIRLPIDAKIVERNEALRSRPKLVNDHPYDRGWVVRIAPTDPASIERSLARAPAIAARLAERIRRMRIHCYPAQPDAELYEIGSECQAALVRLDETLARQGAEDIVLLVTDDVTSPIEMVRWSDRSGHTVLHHRLEGELYHFLVRKEAEPVPKPRPGR